MSNPQRSKDQALVLIEDAIEDYATSIDISSHKLDCIPSVLFGVKHLQRLFLHDNLIELVSPDISNLQRLNTLSLGGNRISQLPESISTLTSLEKLYLANNQLTHLPRGMSCLVRLEVLSLVGNSTLVYPPFDLIDSVKVNKVPSVVHEYLAANAPPTSGVDGGVVEQPKDAASADLRAALVSSNESVRSTRSTKGGKRKSKKKKSSRSRKKSIAAAAGPTKSSSPRPVVAMDPFKQKAAESMKVHLFRLNDIQSELDGLQDKKAELRQKLKEIEEAEANLNKERDQLYTAVVTMGSLLVS